MSLFVHNRYFFFVFFLSTDFFFFGYCLDNRETTQKLLTLRRDAVSAVIFCFYILAGSFRNKRKVLSHLPSPVMSRKFLFDTMMELDSSRYTEDFCNFENESGDNMPEKTFNSQLLNVPTSQSDTSSLPIAMQQEKSHRLWAIVHEASFSQTFTEISEELEKIIAYSKFILGEEKLI